MNCQHKETEDHMICAECGACVESLNEHDICSVCEELIRQTDESQHDR